MLGKLFGKIETYLLRSLRLKNQYPPLFIVGAPRSGTTLVALHLVNRLKFGYFPNNSDKYPTACVSQALWGKLIYQYRPQYASKYGIVDGPFALGDGWRIFHRWFPKYDPSIPVKHESLYELVNIIRLCEIIFQAPFLNKNNHNSVRIQYLNQLFPKALFVQVVRDPLQATLSLLEARERHKVALQAWWSAAPPQFFDRRFSSQLEQSAYTILGVNSFIQQSLAMIDAERWRIVSYEMFCENTEAIEAWVLARYAEQGIAVERRDQYPDRTISFNQQARSVPKQIEAQFQQIVDQMSTEENEKLK